MPNVEVSNTDRHRSSLERGASSARLRSKMSPRNLPSFSTASRNGGSGVRTSRQKNSKTASTPDRALLETQRPRQDPNSARRGWRGKSVPLFPCAIISRDSPRASSLLSPVQNPPARALTCSPRCARGRRDLWASAFPDSADAAPKNCPPHRRTPWNKESLSFTIQVPHLSELPRRDCRSPRGTLMPELGRSGLYWRCQ